MNDETIHQWLIECFGPIQGEEAWQQINQLPFEVREHLMSQDPEHLPKPDEVRNMMQAFSNGGLNSPIDMQNTLKDGPINVKLARSIALQQASGDQSSVNADVAAAARRALSQANLWLDTTCAFNPPQGSSQILSRSTWIEETLDSWVKFANPVAKAVNDALASVFAERLGDADSAEVTGLFAGVVPIPLPEGMNNPAQLITILGNTSFAMQLGQAAGALSHEVNGSFDQGLALLKNPAGGLIPYNCIHYAQMWNLDTTEVLNYLALRELAHARLFASAPWLMPRFEALIIKYASGIAIDLDAVEDQLRDVDAMNPEAISGAVNLSNVAHQDTPEQSQALNSLETLLALAEGWVDCVVWRAGMAHIPHLEQLREMTRRERAAGGPAEVTFEALLGLHLRPRRMRQAASLWDQLTCQKGIDDRDAMWSHPDLLPQLPALSKQIEHEDEPSEETTVTTASNPTQEAESTTQQTHEKESNEPKTTNKDDSNIPTVSDLAEHLDSINWDDELHKLLKDEQGDDTNDEADNA